MKAAIIATRDGIIALVLGAVVLGIGVLAILVVLFTLEAFMDFLEG